MRLFQLFLAPRLIEARLVNDPIALAGGRTAIHVVVEGAGVLTVGRERRRFSGRFSGVIMTSVTPRIVVSARSLFHRVTEELAVRPLPPLPTHAPPTIRTWHVPTPPRIETSVAFSVYPRGRPT
jgi:hypothetical protein